MSSSFDLLSNELIILIALYIPLNEIVNICLTNSQFISLICNNEYFWQLKFHQNYVKINYTPLSWKVLYQNHMNVWSFGGNALGQLGLGDTSYRNVPTLIPSIKAKQISAHECHTTVIDINNNIFIFGENLNSEMQQCEKIPIQIPNIKAKQVSIGDHHIVIIDLDSNVWTFGINEFGQLGLGDYDDRDTPTQIPKLKAQQVIAGYGFTFIIDIDNNIWACGANTYGNLGLNIPKGELVNILQQIPNLKAKQIAAGYEHTVVIDIYDDIWIFGDVKYLYEPIKIPNIKAKKISAGLLHTVVIDLEDNIWSFGYNECGQLGLGDNKNRNTPTQIPNIKAQQISCGASHTVVIDLENNVWVFGKNICGQMGLGDTKDRYIPTQVPNFKATKGSAATDHTILIGIKI